MGNSSSHHHKKHNQQRVKKNVHWTPENAEPPGPPGKPQLLPDSPHSDRDVFSIRWEAPEYDGGSPVQGYLVEHRRTGSPYWVRASPHIVEDTELMVSGLEPGWRYQFRVTAENAVGFSEPGLLSEPLTVTYQRSPAAAPSFVRSLHDTTALEDEKVEFTVQVEGIPTPKVAWYKDGFEIFSSRRQRIVTDNDISTLIIHQAALMDEGEIKCTATNRAGHAITKARLRLEAPPSIRLPKQYEDGLLFEMGEIIKLKVSVAGMPPPTAHWLHNGESLTSGGRYEITHTDKYLNLRINDARRGDRGEYQAHAVNSLGEDMASFLVTVTDRPLPPGKAKVVMTLGKSVTLSWSEPEDDGGCKIGNYIVEYFRLGWNMWLKAATCRQLTTTLGDLIEGSEYKFRVKAENPYGVSEPSEESDVLFIPDPKRGLLEPPVKGQQSPADSSSGFEAEMFRENWYDETKVRGREIKQPSDQTKPGQRNQKPKAWQGDDSLSSGSSVFLSDSDLNRMRNTSSLEGTPVIPKRRTKLPHKEFHKSGSLVSDYNDDADARRRRNTSLERTKYSDKENSSLHSLDNSSHYERMSLEKEKPLYGTDDSLYRARNDAMNRVKKSKSPSPLRHKTRSRETTQSPLAFDSNSSPTSMSPPPRRKRKSKSRSPSDSRSPGSRRRNSSSSSITKEKKSASPLSSPKLLRDVAKPGTSHEKIPIGLKKFSSPQSSPTQARSSSKPSTSQPERLETPQKTLPNRFNLPDIANIATTSKQGMYMDTSDGYTTTDLDEEEMEAMAVKTVIQIKIKPDDVEDKVTQESFSKSESHPFKEDANKLGLHNLSETERKKLSLGTQKSFEDKAERDLSDMLHGSSELMLLLLPNSSRENSEERELRRKEMAIHLSIDNIMAPPVSLSAPEISDGTFYIEDNYDIPIREAFSSTELLHDRKMARLYQSLEEIEAENEEYKKKQKEKTQSVELMKGLTRKRSLTVEDKKKILLERRRSSETEESDTGRNYGEMLDKVKKIKSKLGEDEDMSDVNNVSDDNSKTEEKSGKRITFGNTYHSDLETHNEDDYDIVERNEQHASHIGGDDNNDDSDYYPEKTLHESAYGYDSDDLLEDDILEQDDNSGNRSHTPVIKDDEYYENLGDVLTKKYSLPLNEIQIKIDRPDDEPDFVLKGKYEVDNEMLLKRSKLKPQYSSELSEASNITDDEQEEEEDDHEVDFDELFEQNPEESGEEMDEPINFARNRYNRYIEEEEDHIYHPKSMIMKSQEEELDEPPPVPDHQDDGPEIPERSSSMVNHRLSPHSMLKKQPVKPILKNKGQKVGKILDVEIHIDNSEPHFDSIILNSPKAPRKKKGSPEGSRSSRLSSILKPILKRDKDRKDVEKDSENFKQFPIKSGGNILLIPKSLQKVSDVETSDTDTEKARRKHVRITEPGNTSDENDLTRTAVINHYSDLVKEYGTKTKSAAPKMILNYEELKARATEVENGLSVDWDSVVEPLGERAENEENTNEMPDPFSVNKFLEETNRFGIEFSVPKNNAMETELNRDRPMSNRNASKLNGKKHSRKHPNGVSENSISRQQRSRESSVTKDLDQQLVPVVVTKERQQRIHSYFDYTVDVFVFGIACWIYFFKHPILCVPILLLLLFKQIYENWESFLFWKKYYKQYEQTPPK